ncbi:MAG: alpha/beta hydrolase [Planktotalea sp.]|jgi:pimeloyl-ACP methyl ester carboxylesterase|uniref:alpha/beta fold hydrolase n=2 Tax=Planktotalea sp. TaxID=2029877 RepID=UPI0026251B91|nr:alpha/beta hydrolase [Planktotalea sp.]MDG1077653.1 alpha/beta hydrolase [Planktotalea sp.]
MHPRWFTLNGQDFFARTWGDPSLPPLLMLHGFPEYSGAWEEVAQELCDRFYCIAPDQRGYGQSYCPDGVENYRTGVLASDMAALAAELGAPVTVMGHDWGASVAYGLAMFFPDVVARLIIVNGVHPVPFQKAMAAGGAQSEASQYINALRREGSEEYLARDDFSKLLQLFSAHMDLSWLTGEKLAAYKVEWGREGRLKAMINWYRASTLVVADPGVPVDLPQIDTSRLHVACPHLLIWGMDDTALLPVSRKGLEEFAKDLTIQEIKNADHWLLRQKADEVAQIIRNWMSQ